MALVLHIFDSMLPLQYIFPGLPGVKLGLANIISLFVIVNMGLKYGLLVSVLRSTLAAIFTGTIFSFVFLLSFSGAVVSTLVMGLLYHTARRHLTMVGLSLAGAVAHNMAQIIAASSIIGTRLVMVYFPYLLLYAIPTGLFVGMVTARMQRFFLQNPFLRSTD